jgi:16S rRNA (cytosine1402-N4)-methyltransferase
LNSLWSTARAIGADHIPVLAEEVLQLLRVHPGATVIDATFGAGGHAALLADQLRGAGRLLAIDRDPDALPCFERFARITDVEARFFCDTFDTVLAYLAGVGTRADAVLFDLGISSMQVDRPDRGFSYSSDGPLDMRMGPFTGRTAADIVNLSSEHELREIFWQFGEERYAAEIARAIVARRHACPYMTTLDLAATVTAIVSARRRDRRHPARRVFQALRIAVNRELALLNRAIPIAFRVLRPGGRLAVITFHSLEYRIVRRVFARYESRSFSWPSGSHDFSIGARRLELLTPQPIKPRHDEAAWNPRCASARLLAVRKLTTGD